MKKIIFLSFALAISAISFTQTLTANSTTAINLQGNVNKKNWNIANGEATVSLGAGGSVSDYIYFGGFDLSLIPNSAYINGLSITITRNSSATVVDSSVRLVLNGSLYYTNDVTASATPTTWPTTAGASIYTFPASSIAFLTGADLKNAGFGIAISARRTAGNPTATVNSVATLNVTYLTLAPIILTDFTVSRNAENQVVIRFTTSTEENVRNIFVERSADGKTFEKLFTIAPKGDRNVYTKYEATDKAPMCGNNYYRISEVDKDGRMHYYITKLINMGVARQFNAYYNGSQIVARVNIAPGQYDLGVVDMSGVTVSRKQVTLSGTSSQMTLDAPSRTGIYIVTLKGHGVSESTRVPVTR